MYARNSKFMELEALANLNKLRISSSAMIKEGMVTVSVLLSDNEGQSINRYSRLESLSSDPSIIQKLHQEAFVEAVTDYFSIESDFTKNVVPTESAEETAETTQERVTEHVEGEMTKEDKAEGGEDFPVLFGKYKCMQDGNMFSQLLKKDPETLKKLLRVPHPTAPAMIEYQQKAKDFLEARNIEL